MPPDFRLSALRMRRTVPDLYEAFLKDFGAYTDVVTVAVTDAPADQVLVAQGMARQCRSIRRALEECHLVERPKPQQPAS